jgi:hypothetical protein
MAKKDRYAVHMTYADGAPGLSFHPTLAAATEAAQMPTHGGRRVVVAEVRERLANGAELTRQTFRP